MHPHWTASRETHPQRERPMAKECDAELRLSDDHGDNDCTMRCQGLPENEGPHREKFQGEGRAFAVTWRLDERRVDLATPTTGTLRRSPTTALRAVNRFVRLPMPVT